MGRLTTNLRPLMLGLVVKPGDWSGLLEAIETASVFWGGMLFPLIPSRRRITGALRREIPRRTSATQMLTGYVDAFDPDVLVKVNDAEMPATIAGHREIVASTKLFQQFSDDGTPRFGIGALELISYFVETELTYVRKQPLRIVIPRLGKNYRAFLASVFGQLPSQIDSAVRALFPAGTEIETPECSIENFGTFLAPETLFLRRLMNQHLRFVRPTRVCIF